MASGADACWRCGVAWAAEDPPATTLRLVPAPPPEVPGTLYPALPATGIAVAAVGS